MVRVSSARFAFAAVTLAAFLISFAAPWSYAQNPAAPTGSQITVSTSSANNQPPASPTPASPIAGVPPPLASHGVHAVTVTFDYDFGKTPACTANITTHCIQQFIAYDVSTSAAHPAMLFPISLPANPVGLVKGISKPGPPIDFASGKHIISVSAMSPDGTHSKRSLCTTSITIP
jgi:hypothetical protein